MNESENNQFSPPDKENGPIPDSAVCFSSSAPPFSDAIPLKEEGEYRISSSAPDTPTASEHATSDHSSSEVKGEAWVIPFSAVSRKKTSAPPFRSSPRVTPPAIPQCHPSPPPSFPALKAPRMVSRKEMEVLQGKHRCAAAVGSREEDEGGMSTRMRVNHSAEGLTTQAKTEAAAPISSLEDHSSPSPVLPPFAESDRNEVLPLGPEAPPSFSSSSPVGAAVPTFIERPLPGMDGRTSTVTRGASDGASLSSSSAVPAVEMNTETRGEAMQTQGGSGLEDGIPRYPDTTRADLEKRLVLRVPRLCCIQKQYPRSCGITSLTSVYNYLYSRLGESFSEEEGIHRPPFTQEEIISTLGFSAPYGDIPWGSFTGNITLIRWFNALNAYFGFKGKAYILYKVHGAGNTSHLYQNDAQALVAVKEALCNPHCAIIYHCYNHYMVPVGYQEIPHDQRECLCPDVATDATDTTVFIGEVSRGKHEAMYARKWKDIVKDLSCCGGTYFNIRQPEKGIQRKEKPKDDNGTKTETECEGNGNAVSFSVEEEEEEEEGRSAMDDTSCVSSLSGRGRSNGILSKEKEPQNRAKENQEKKKARRKDNPKRITDLISSTRKRDPPSILNAPIPFSEGSAMSSEVTSLLSRSQTSTDREGNLSSRQNPPSEGAASDPSNLSTAASVERASTPRQCSQAVVTSPSCPITKKPNNVHCFICFRNDEAYPVEVVMKDQKKE